MKLPRTTLTAAVLATTLLVACGDAAPTDDGAVTIAAPFYALEYAATLAAGDEAHVFSVTTPGMDPHDTELSPRQMAELTQADIVIYLPLFQPAVDNAIEQAGDIRVLDVSQIIELHPADGHDYDHGNNADDHDDDGHDHDHGHDHGLHDPHFWTDPVLLGEVTRALTAELADLDPDNADAYLANAESAATLLGDLDADYSAGLANCERRAFIPQHAAFSYLAERYDLEQVSVAGLSPDEEPSPSRIAEVQALAAEHGITTIFFEPGHSDAIARSIATDLGLELAILDPIETISDASPGEDYAAIMRANLAALEEANACD